MATMNISLPDQMKECVDAQTASGRYGNASDYVRDLIRKDQDRAAAFAALQAEITKGVESGIAEEWDPEEFRKRMRAKYGGL
ncbi:type II toxin-antitoxin system ParD family antitoxin [Nioella aestuarii]|uniref:type II toxin-antitoxin system ParD family antitoxin n=1 Tax=Nioella aestuarii TaxID=1662864 RepID=UPI003D7FF1BA